MKHALVIDDHPLVCQALKGLLHTHFPSLEVTTSTGGDGVLQAVCGAPWAFVVLDVNLPGPDGLHILKQTRGCCPHVPIIIYSTYSERQYASRALLAGAIAYLSKESSPFELIEIVSQILDGGRIRRSIAQQPRLSERERQVLTLLSKGMSHADIAHALEISEKTVSTHQANLILKLGLRNSVELVRYAIEEGFAD
jgi:DNA-binding NarL/FixJ family response regulator